MKELENLCALLFELSSEDRLGILRQIEKEATNVSGLSRKLNLTTQESSRHTSRLSDVGLAQKDSSGLYRLTPYGELVLRQLEGLMFVSKNKGYFSSHSLGHLPREFIYRMGDLAESRYVNDISLAYYNVERLMREAEEYIWVITDHSLLSTMPLYTDAFERKVNVRTIEPQDWVVPPEIKVGFRDLPGRHWEAAERARADEILEEGLVERLDVYIYMSEKEAAIVCFPLLDGRFDYLGFTSTDERAQRWCKDLFQYYWERSHSREGVAEELLEWIRNRPEAIYALESIAAGEDILHGRDYVPELERRFLVKEGKLTILGDIVLVRLRGK
ncbi:MAG: helix-turn-helix transcriptional regulator [Candidatus Bathyarchaeia archaeon]